MNIISVAFILLITRLNPNVLIISETPKKLNYFECKQKILKHIFKVFCVEKIIYTSDFAMVLDLNRY